MSGIAKLATAMQKTPIDRVSLPQQDLDLQARMGRTSLYPWRGQFSPGLVDLLLQAHAEAGSHVLDPFVGSGTTLFESARRGCMSTGVEVNPAAYLFASIARFVNQNAVSRQDAVGVAEDLLGRSIGGFGQLELLVEVEQPLAGSLEESVRDALGVAAEKDEMAELLLATSVLLSMGNGERLDAEKLRAAFRKNSAKVLDLPFSEAECRVELGDARRLPCSDTSVDLVLTSPPYINVFNYHQNYRKAVELIGWRPLNIAPSEMGANRKYRSNRFLTVVQYCLDLAQVFMELRRVLTADGEAIMVIGRESSVRGCGFNNGLVLAIVATGGCGLTLRRWQERKFVTRYGETIFEEILTFGHDGDPVDSVLEFAREVGVWALGRAIDEFPSEGKPDVLGDLKQAVARSEDVSPSPLSSGAVTARAATRSSSPT